MEPISTLYIYTLALTVVTSFFSVLKKDKTEGRNSSKNLEQHAHKTKNEYIWQVILIHFNLNKIY